MSDTQTPQAASWASVPKRTLLADDTYKILREALITNRLAPGQRLNIEELAHDLGVSITPIRHALVRLTSEGFVTREPFKGYVASELLDRATVAEIYEARTAIETVMASNAARRATPRDVAFLSSLARRDPLELFEPAATTDQGADSTRSVDAALHRGIAELAGNRTMVDMLDGLNKRMSAYRTFKNLRADPGSEWNPTRAAIQITKKEHAAIVRAIEKHDVRGAREAMRHHLESASQRDIDPLPPRTADESG